MNVHNIHVSYDGHAGGGTEQILDTANYADYTVPQGKGVWLYGVLAVATTVTSVDYVKLYMKEWDGELIYVPIKVKSQLDSKDYYMLPKPRFCPGGAVLKHYALHNAAEDVMVMVLTRPDGPLSSITSLKGETQIEQADDIANSGIKVWKVTDSIKFSQKRGPHYITGGVVLGANIIAARLIIPNALNSARPMLHVAAPPGAGVEGPVIGKLLEPIKVLAGETIQIEVWSVGVVATTSWIEFVSTGGRSGVPKPPSVSLGGVTGFYAGGGASASMRLGFGLR